MPEMERPIMSGPVEREDLAHKCDEVLESRGSIAYVSGVTEYAGGERYVSIDGAYSAGDLRAIADTLDPPWWKRIGR